jgi:hypothetical protein
MPISTIGSDGLASSSVTSTQIAAGAVIQADLATNVAGNGPAFSAYQSSAQALSAATTTLITFQTEEWDTGSCYNNTGSTVTLNGLSVPAWSFCPNVAGYYIVDFAFTRATNNTDMTIFIFKNASAYKQGSTVYTNCGSLTMSCIVLLNGTGDYIQAYGYLGSAQNVSATSVNTYFQAAMIRSA